MKKQRKFPCRAAVLLEAALMIPTNWCDPLLTGPKKVISDRADCASIEALLWGLRRRILEAAEAADVTPKRKAKRARK